jgi:hypothetical protein
MTKALFTIAVLLSAALVPAGEGRTGPGPKRKAAGREVRRYAIVVEEKALQEEGWKGVVETLEKKRSARVFHWEGGVDGLRSRLAAWHPCYVCFVARPEELAREEKVQVQGSDGAVHEVPLCGAFYHDICALMRSLNDDPYDDAMWGVVTGATPEDARRVVSAKPLTVRRGLSHVGSGWLDWLESGVSFNEGEKGKKYVKGPGKPIETVQGPDDTTAEFVKELNSGKVDMVSSSGHATEHDWQMGFNYKDGKLIPGAAIEREPEAVRENYEKARMAREKKSKVKGEGKNRETKGEKPGTNLLGVSSTNEVHEVLATNPKVYYSPGNCLIGRVDGKDCMALSWVHHGAVQFFGHIGLQTRSCHAWGITEYFLSLQGRFDFAEAVFLNRQAMQWELARGQHGPQDYLCCRNEARVPIPQERRVLWETTVFYGDPAWEARVKPVVDPLYDQGLSVKELDGGREELTFTVKMRRASRPGRPAAFLVEPRIRSAVEVKEGPKDLVVKDAFALVPFWEAGEKAPEVGQEYRAVAVVEVEEEKAEKPEKRERAEKR